MMDDAMDDKTRFTSAVVFARRFLGEKYSNTGPEIKTCTWLRECCRQVEAEMVIKNFTKPHVQALISDPVHKLSHKR